MTVLVDTTIWSLALRRRRPRLDTRERSLVEEWASLVGTGSAALIGPIRQKILSGIRRPETFRALRESLSDFRYLEILPIDYDQAASFYNDCRAHGVVGSAVDMLICASAHRHRVAIFTTDADFVRYAKLIPIRLHESNSP